MLKPFGIVLAVVLAVYPAAAFASGCKEAGRMANFPTEIELVADTDAPMPGVTTLLGALVETDGFLSVYCGPPETVLGGYIEFLVDNEIIGRVQVTQWNTPSTHVATVDMCAGIPGSPPCYAYYYGAQQTALGMYYTPPLDSGFSEIRARFTGDNYFSSGSSSNTLRVLPASDITPVVYLLVGT